MRREHNACNAPPPKLLFIFPYLTHDQRTLLRFARRRDAVIGGMLFTAVCLALIYTIIEYGFGGQIDIIFIAMEVVHFFGILVLLRKLLKEKSCEGLSVRMQEMTAMYLVARVLSGAVFEGNHHTILDILTLVVTLVVLYNMYTSLKHTVDKEHDMKKRTMALYIILPCAVLAVVVNPNVQLQHGIIARVCNVLWAFALYLEAISVLPQLLIMKHINDQVGYFERKSTADYVFALGIARFLGCASWCLQPSTFRYVFNMTLQFRLWGLMTLIAEIVQTFILADFCYYYVKSVADGSGLVQFGSSNV